MRSILADHFDVEEWMNKVKTGVAQLPEFQRDVVWNYQKVVDLLQAIYRGQPVGCLLVLKSKSEPLFDVRPIEGAEIVPEAPCEFLILDGQQRITALWRSLTDSDKTHRYFLKFEASDEQKKEAKADNSGSNPAHSIDESSSTLEIAVKAHRRTLLWTNDPKKCYEKDLVPVSVLWDLSRDNDSIRDWVDKAVKGSSKNSELIDELRNLERWVIARSKELRSFMLPFLPMPESTTKDEAITTFLECNTSSHNLNKFDIVVGMILKGKESNLRESRNSLFEKAGKLENYFNEQEVGDLLLKIACLRCNLAPTESNYGKDDVLEDLSTNLNEIIEGVNWTLELLHYDYIFDKKRLPSAVPFRVLPALHKFLPSSNHPHGAAARKTAQAFIWRTFLTDRYARTVATALFEDYKALRSLFENPHDNKKIEDVVPIWNIDEYPLPRAEELREFEWPTRTTRAKAILAISLRAGARDIGSGIRIDETNIRGREYHHLFPRAMLETNVAEGEVKPNIALNCILIETKTNRQAADKEPLKYLESRLVSAAGSEISKHDIEARLKSHLVEFEWLCKQEGKSVAKWYDEFLKKRAQVLKLHIDALVKGDDLL